MFTNKIGYWAEIKGIKHKHLAAACNVSIQTFSRWVNNKTQPNLEESQIIATELGITIDQLINGEENKNGEKR